MQQREKVTTVGYKADSFVQQYCGNGPVVKRRSSAEMCRGVVKLCERLANSHKSFEATCTGQVLLHRKKDRSLIYCSNAHLER